MLDVRFGFFKYGVDVLPNDFGTTPAADAGIPGLNLGDDFTSGLPVLRAQRRSRRRCSFGSGLGRRPLQLPAGRAREAGPDRLEPHALLGNHTVKFGVDVRRAYNLRVPSDSHRSGQLYFNEQGTAGPSGGGLGLATFLLGNVERMVRYVSPNTDARERQWRHFYYVQDTWRATPKLTLNYGLRADIINPQTVNEAGNGGWLDIDTGEIRVGGVGDINLAGNVKNKINWAPRLGRDLPDQPQDGDPRRLRPQLRHRRVRVHLRPLRDPEPARARVPGPEPAQHFHSVFNLAQGPPAPVFPAVPSNGRFPLPNGVFARALPDDAEPRPRGRLQRHAAAGAHERPSPPRSPTSATGAAGFIGDGPAANYNQPTHRGLRHAVPGPAQAVLHCGVKNADGLRQLRLDAGHRLLQQHGEEPLQRAAGQAHQALLGRLLAADPLHAPEPQEQRRRLLLHRPRRELRPGQLHPHARVRAGGRRPSCPSARGSASSRTRRAPDAILGGWQVNANATVMSGLPFNVSYRDAGADRDTGPEPSEPHRRSAGRAAATA